MANEAVLKTRTDHPINFTVTNGTAIEKGALLKLTDNMTAVISTASNEYIAGIAASEKIEDDGIVRLGVYRRGIFLMYLSGTSVVAGYPVCANTTSYPNMIGNAGTALSGSQIIGTALENGSAGNQVLIDLNIGAGTASGIA